MDSSASLQVPPSARMGILFEVFHERLKLGQACRLGYSGVTEA